MVLFSQEIYKLLNCALTELTTSKSSGKIQNNSLSEAHYLGAWVTMAMKKKRFDTVVLETLKGWQKQARSLGQNAGLKEQFIYLENCYKQLLGSDNQMKAVSIEQFKALYSTLSDQQWVVTTDLEVGTKLSRPSGGKDSLVICAEQIEKCFDQQGVLVKAISLYIRGDKQTLIDLAFKENILLYKKTDYKSKVKYHGEFVIYPNNDGGSLPEFPIVEEKEA